MFPIKFNDVTLLPFQVMDSLLSEIVEEKSFDRVFKNVSSNN